MENVSFLPKYHCYTYNKTEDGDKKYLQKLLVFCLIN